jgi:hypothetical protein
MNKTKTPLERVLWSAGPPPATPIWAGLHDQVMGGRSQGRAQLQNGDVSAPDHVLFSGLISRDNGGVKSRLVINALLEQLGIFLMPDFQRLNG